jgi:uncharacterized protein (DUF2384 family)
MTPRSTTATPISAGTSAKQASDESFMNAPNYNLGGQTPASQMNTPAGRETVKHMKAALGYHNT